MPEYSGPYDSSDIHAPAELVDFGSIAFAPNPQVTVRVEVEGEAGRIVAISFDYKESTLQVQAFASPKGHSIWEEVVEDLTNNLSAQGASVQQQVGPFGIEILTELAVGMGSITPVRMFGFNGERWLLRGTISGESAKEIEVKTFLEDLFKGIVVNRGELPLPPRELLPLALPQGAIVPKVTQ